MIWRIGAQGVNIIAENVAAVLCVTAEHAVRMNVKNAAGTVRYAGIAPIRREKSCRKQYLFSAGKSRCPKQLRVECGDTQYQQATPLDCHIPLGMATLRQLVRGVSAAASVRAEQTSTGRLAPLKPLWEKWRSE